MAYQRALRVSDLRPGSGTRVVLDGQGVLLALVDDEPRALADLCPHNGALLSEGVIRDGCVTCPSHLWRFSLVDGARQGFPEVRVRVYDTRVNADGWVEVDVPPAAPQRSLRETLLAHARGEVVD
jgi:nitrite reductase (NADH) small subunit